VEDVKEPAALVNGEVRGPDGRPVEGARVVITASPVPMPEIAPVTDAEGRFAMAAPAPGEYAFSAYTDGPGGPATGSVHVPHPAAGAEPASLPSSATVAETASVAPTESLADDAEMSSDDPMPQAAPAGPAAEVHVVLTFPSSSP
jgi:hypothetical protein